MRFVSSEVNVQEIFEEKKRRNFPKIFDFLILIFFAIFLGAIISFQKSYIVPALEPDEISDVDVVAPFDFEAIDKVATQEKIEEEANLVNPVYLLDYYKFSLTERKIKDIFALGRDFLLRGEVKGEKLAVQLLRDGIRNVFEVEINPELLKFLIKEKFDFEIEDTILSVLKRAYDKGIFLTKTSAPNRNGMISIISKDGKLKNINVDEALDLVTFKKFIENAASSGGLEPFEVKNISEFCSLFIAPNLIYDEALTEQKRKEAQERVFPVVMRIPKGKVIVKKGEKVTQKEAEIISLLRKRIGVPFSFSNFLFCFMMILPGGIIAFPFYNLFPFFEVSSRKRHILFLALIFLEVFLIKSFSFLAEGSKYKESLNFAFPYFLFPLLISYLLDRKSAFFFTFLSIIPLSVLYFEKPEIIIYALLTSFLASAGANIYSKVERYSIMKVMILIILPFNALLIFLLSYAKNNLSSIFPILLGMLSGVVFSLIFAPILIPLLEITFGILTEMRLAELTNSEHPLLKRMAMEAPGTYHHSLMVASLAEQAARSIGANYNLARVSALFHDAGKLEEPQYFIENQERDFNIHDRLSPEKSSSIIINHVSKGIEILKKFKIPPIIREIVQQHHGESLVVSFYQKAVSETEVKGGKPHEKLFRYAGPKPQNKEASILMLSDAVEAASKSLSEWDSETMGRMIDEIITKFLEDGQLDESGLTIRDLYLIAYSFYNTFVKFYKQRVPYPGFEFKKEPLPIQ